MVAAGWSTVEICGSKRGPVLEELVLSHGGLILGARWNEVDIDWSSYLNIYSNSTGHFEMKGR